MRVSLFLCCAAVLLVAVAGQSCPSNGVRCVVQCGTQYQQCSGTTFWPAQSVPSGTVCCNGNIVYPNDPCCKSATTATPQTTTPTPQTTTSKPASTSAPQTTTPTPQTTTTKPTTTPGCSLADIFSPDNFRQMFPNANLAANRGDRGQYPIFTYDNFKNAAAAFPAFTCTGSLAARKKELAAFLAQTSQESSGWWSGQDYIWGYVYSTELCSTTGSCDPYCALSGDLPCAAGQQYYGRGPLQLSWNYNYGAASLALFGDKNILLNNPNQLNTDGVLAFKCALWFWMTAQSPKPSCHDVITGVWVPSSTDQAAGRVPSFGQLTNIINGGIECGTGATPSPQSVNRAGYYAKYTSVLGFSDTNNVYCNNMQHY